MKQIVRGAVVKDGKFLLMKRSNYSDAFPGVWEFPGDKVENDETLQEALVRETLEECNLTVKPLEVVMTSTSHFRDKDYKFNFFSTEFLGGEVELSEEHTEYKWVSRKEAMSMNVEFQVKKFSTK